LKLLKPLMILSLLSISGCSTLNPLGALSPTPKVVAQVGKENKNEDNLIKAEANTSSVQEAETITNTQDQTANTIENVTQNLPLEYLLIVSLLAGWAIPTPLECYKGVKIIVGDIFNGVMYPVKGLGNWLLKLFNRGV